MLLDNPTGGLDPSSKRMLWRYILRRCDTKSLLVATQSLVCLFVFLLYCVFYCLSSLLFSSFCIAKIQCVQFQQEECRALCDRMAIMVKGSVKALGPLPKLKRASERVLIISMVLASKEVRVYCVYCVYCVFCMLCTVYCIHFASFTGSTCSR